MAFCSVLNCPRFTFRNTGLSQQITVISSTILLKYKIFTSNIRTCLSSSLWIRKYNNKCTFDFYLETIGERLLIFWVNMKTYCQVYKSELESFWELDSIMMRSFLGRWWSCATLQWSLDTWGGDGAGKILEIWRQGELILVSRTYYYGGWQQTGERFGGRIWLVKWRESTWRKAVRWMEGAGRE